MSTQTGLPPLTIKNSTMHELHGEVHFTAGQCSLRRCLQLIIEMYHLHNLYKDCQHNSSL